MAEVNAASTSHTQRSTPPSSRPREQTHESHEARFARLERSVRKLITWSHNFQRRSRSTSRHRKPRPQTLGPESNTRAGVITTRPIRSVRRNAELPAPGTRETRAVARRCGIRQRLFILPPHFRDRRRDKYILPNRHGCRRLRVPKKQAPGNTKEGRLRAVRHQRDDHARPR
jgi:hypothetical protein